MKDKFDVLVTVSVTNPTAEITGRMMQLYEALQELGLQVSLSSTPMLEDES